MEKDRVSENIKVFGCLLVIVGVIVVAIGIVLYNVIFK